MIGNPVVLSGGLRVIAEGNYNSADETIVTADKPIQIAFFKSYYLGDSAAPAWVSANTNPNTRVYQAVGASTNYVNITLQNETELKFSRSETATNFLVHYIALG